MGRSHAKVHKQRRNLNTHVFPSARESFTLRPRAGIDRIQRRIPTSGTNSVYTDPSKMRLSLDRKMHYHRHYINRFRAPIAGEQDDFFDAREPSSDVYRDLMAARESPPAPKVESDDEFFDSSEVSAGFFNDGGEFSNVVVAARAADAIAAQAERAERLIQIRNQQAARTVTNTVRGMRRTRPPVLPTPAPARRRAIRLQGLPPNSPARLGEATGQVQRLAGDIEEKERQRLARQRRELARLI